MAERVEGLHDLKAALNELSADLKRKIIRAALRDAAAPMAKAARDAAPVLKTEHPYRLPGTLKRSIITKASKRYRGQNGEIGVYISASKLKGLGGKAGARNPFDPFYWRFQEFGTQKQPAKPFLNPAFNTHVHQAIAIFQARIKVRIEKADKRK